MVESGLVTLIQNGLNDPTIKGGFPAILPRDLISFTTPRAWSYRSILSTPIYSLNGLNQLTMWQVQLDSHGYTASDAQFLARRINGVLRNWQGTLSDTDNTKVLGMFRMGGCVDGFSDANRSYVRSVDYEIHYYDNFDFVSSLFTYYIDPINGRDTNEGTSEQTAWLTPADQQRLLTGQTIGYLLDGTWWLYRTKDMSADLGNLPAGLVTAPADSF